MKSKGLQSGTKCYITWLGQLLNNKSSFAEHQRKQHRKCFFLVPPIVANAVLQWVDELSIGVFRQNTVLYSFSSSLILKIIQFDKKTADYICIICLMHHLECTHTHRIFKEVRMDHCRLRHSHCVYLRLRIDLVGYRAAQKKCALLLLWTQLKDGLTLTKLEIHWL